MLFPVIGIIQVGNQAYADRYSYLPVIGLLLIGGFEIERVTIRWKKIAGVICLLFLVYFCISSRSYVKKWQDTRTLFNHTVMVTNNNYIAHTLLGVALVQQEEFGKALEQFERAYAIKPDAQRAWLNMGIALEGLGSYSRAEDAYRTALAQNASQWKVLNNLGILLIRTRRCDEALNHLREASVLHPDSWELETNLGLAHLCLGDTVSAFTSFKNAAVLQTALLNPLRRLTSLAIDRGDSATVDSLVAVFSRRASTAKHFFWLGQLWDRRLNKEKAAGWYARAFGTAHISAYTPQILDSLMNSEMKK
jgi:Tfp pilus assembly protein PilF